MGPDCGPTARTAPGLDEQWGDDRRADARRNHERVTAAALEVFAERGLDATIPDIAARAGVGKATVYRSFPTKDDLLAAVALRQTSQAEQRIAAALKTPGPAAALGEVVRCLFEQMRANQLTMGILQTSVVLATNATRQRILDMIGQAIEAAQTAGAVRGDATVDDLIILATGCATRLHLLGVTDPGTWQRYATLVLAALRPGPDPLPASRPASPGPRPPRS